MLKPQGGVFPGGAGATLRKGCSPAVLPLSGAFVQFSSLHTWPDLLYGSNLAEKNILEVLKWTEAHHTLLLHGPGLDTEQCVSVCLSVCVPTCGEADAVDRLRDWVSEGPSGKHKS